MKILTVTDAWQPQVNGVVRTIEATHRECELLGHETALITPRHFSTVPCPRYPEIRLSVLPYRRVAQLMRLHLVSGQDTAIHIATEGPLGAAARRYCVRHGLPFTTAYHTRFPQYVKAMFGVPERWVYGFLRRFHGAARRVLSPTPEVDRELAQIGLTDVVRWTRGVDLEMFYPRAVESALVAGTERPRFLYVGRVSVEKSVDAFLALDLPGTRIVAGAGPALDTLKRRFPDVRFVGVLPRDELASLYSSVDAFVFPSRTDTFGLVMLEALACGTPVAALPVQGPIDVLGGSDAACLDENLQRAALHALRIPRERCRVHAERFSWRAATEQFLALQIPCRQVGAGTPETAAAHAQ
jgi:glycosyltransferase involved in cell wall biosynthesis